MMSSYPNQPKRPRLSLQIKPVVGINSRASKTLAIIDPKSPTAFNTLSNAYAAVVDRSTPVQAEPITAINTLQSAQPQTAIEHPKDQKLRVQTPYNSAYPETPLTAHPITPNGPMDFAFPSVMTATPPLSAGPTDNSDPKVFTFNATDVPARLTGILSPTEPRTPRRRTTLNTTTPSKPPYTHPRALHSILRNSPLPPLTTRTPMSPRRQSLRLQEKAAKRVGYNNPLTQTITTNKYTKSHIDLLVEEASPYSPMSAEDDPEIALDLALAYTGNETRDGGMTPGPFEEMRRRMAGLGTETPSSPSGIRKRKKKEKKRRWVWTIGQEDEEEEVGGAMAALRAAEASGTLTIHPAPTSFVSAPAPVVGVPEQIGREQSADLSECESWDVPMSDSSSFVSEDQAVTPMYQDEDVDMRTPTVEKIDKADQTPVFPARLGSVGLMGEGRGRRDTPIPPDLLPSAQ